jgi:regulator of sirC expression with transglutaminase-like and TPR domain
VDATERFTELVRRPDPDIPLDEAAALIAAHAHPGLDVDAVIGSLDTLAEGFGGDDADALARYLFVEQGFAGNSADYGDPRNSYLDDVLARRLGIPITLSIVMIEVGRRRALTVLGVGMPGHFLVRPAGDPNTWFDPFDHGRRLDRAGCRALFAAVRGAEEGFADDYLEPVGNRAILGRVLANLSATLVRREPSAATWALRLRLRIPGLAAAERHGAATALASLGSFVEAAAALGALASELSGDAAEKVERQATAVRARAN